MVTLDTWQILTILCVLCTALWAFGKLFFGQTIKALGTRFEQYELELKDENDRRERMELNIRQVERDFLMFRAELPERYVLKADLDRFREFIEMRVQEIRSLIIGLDAAIKAKADKE